MANYRHQNNSVLATAVPCATCFVPSISVTACYSATDATVLCCGAPTSTVVYFIETETFANATDFYTSAARTTKSPDGYYSNDLAAGCGPTPDCCPDTINVQVNTTATWVDCNGVQQTYACSTNSAEYSAGANECLQVPRNVSCL
jgi:hypothetical protein